MSAVPGVARSQVVRATDSKGWVIHALADGAFDGALGAPRLASVWGGT